MQKRTNRALAISLGLHIVAMLAVSPFLIQHFNIEKERISAEILAPEVEKQIRKRVLPPRTPLVPQLNETESSTSSPVSPTSAPEVSLPKAPIHADVVPDVVTHADISQTDAPTLVSNASFGEDGVASGPVVIEGHKDGGVGGPGRGGNGVGKHFAHGTGAIDVGLTTLGGIDAGLGIFGTDVMSGHGLIGQVYVPGWTIERMPDFDQLTPVYTFVTPNLDVPKRGYTEGFPTPERQSVVENFAIRFRGELAVDTPGTYTFRLVSDDGSKLYINGTLVIDNDGIHGLSHGKVGASVTVGEETIWERSREYGSPGKQGSLKLAAGTHPFEIQYFQGPRYEIALQWFYQPPNGHRQIVPPDIIYRPGKPKVPEALKKLQQRLKRIENMGSANE